MGEKKINIITSFYLTSSKDRQEELDNALLNNINSNLIKSVHLFLDNNACLDYLNDIFFENKNFLKIVVISSRKQPFYNDLLSYANTLNQEICMVCNSDIWLKNIEDIKIINRLNSKMIYALTRYEYDMSCPLIDHYQGSHDSFIFRSPLNNNIIKHLNFPQNVWGSENVLLYELNKFNYKIYNPCKQVIIIHEHQSELRDGNRNRINTGDYDGDNVYKIRSEMCYPSYIEYVKVISFSLWGDNPNYNVGAIENAKLARLSYPDFECWFYVHIDSVPEDTIIQLNKIDNVKIIKRSGDLSNLKPMMWRFEAIDEPNVYINMSRDTDTRILLREKLAVYEWIKSPYLFHIMRDHPHHMNHDTPIMGGMFGTKKIADIPSWKTIINTIQVTDDERYLYDTDQKLLKTYIYPKIKDRCLIHSSFGCLDYEKDCTYKKFPLNFCNNFKFVGGYINYDGTDSIPHREILMNSV
jgi:hypothetical protein